MSLSFQKIFGKIPGWLKLFLYMAFMSLVLLWPAFYNRYPLVFSDTGTYLLSAFTLDVPFDRPLGYGYFIRLFSFGQSLWPVVYVQAFCTVFLLWKMCVLLFSGYKKHPYTFHAISVVFLAVLSPLPWMVSQMMPDLFPALVFLLAVVFVFAEQSRFARFLLAVTLVFFLITHTANFLLLMGLCIGMGIFLFAVHAFRKDRKLFLRRVMALFCLGFFAPVFFMASNYHQGFGPVISPSSYAFMMSRMNDAGVLDEYLDERCDDTDYVLCGYRGHLLRGDAFLWDASSPLNIGGWERLKAEFEGVLKEIFGSVHYATRFFGDSVLRSVDLFVHVGIDDYHAYGSDGPVFPRIRDYLPGERESYESALQYRGELPGLAVFSGLYGVFFFIALAGLFFLGVRKELLPFEAALGYSAIVFLLTNAVIMATLSGVYTRYQGRAAWLVPFLALLFCLRVLARQGKSSSRR